MLLTIAVSLRAQVVNDGATNMLSNVTNIVSGDVTVGTNGSFTLLVLSNNTLLTNSAHGLIGRNATARSNEVRLISATARWLLASNLLVGNDGSFNRLVISNGGGVRNNFGRLGANPSSSNNEALVTGPGSSWISLNEFNVGNFGAGNRLLVNNGGSVRSEQDSYIGLAGNNNEALVAGPDSSWTSLGEFFVGFFGRGNRLVVSDGGVVRNSLAGYFGAGTTGSNNLALVTGSGSAWSNASDLYVGFAGAGNQLVVSNGAIVTANNGVIGNNAGARLNSAVLMDPGTRWLIGNDLFVGSNGASSLLVLSNGALVANGPAVVGFGASSSNNMALVTGAGSIWSNRNSLGLGESGSGNRLVITNGGRVISSGGLLSLNFGSRSNEAVVAGSGSSWSMSGNLLVGNNDVGNRLSVSSGGVVRNSSGSLGVAFTSSNNEAVVTGAGSLWSNALDVTVGFTGARNRLIVSNEGTLTARGRVTLGAFSGSTNNRVVVDGGIMRATDATGAGVLDVRRGTNVLNAGLIDVDLLLMTNTLGVFEFNGGTLITRDAVVSNNLPFVIGRGGANPAVWDVRAGTSNHLLSRDLEVGNSVPFCQLLVTNGARLENNNGYIGLEPSGSNCLALVTGTGSLWTNRGEMYVGYTSSGNQLIISNGGTVAAQLTRFLTHASGAVSNNTAIVTGAGSGWLGPGNLEVGGPGAFCRLLVSDGARVENNVGFVGSGANNNLAMVTGLGTVWTNSGALHVGFSGTGHQLVVSNGGAVSAARDGIIGRNNGANSNTAIVTDFGSRWLVNSNLYVGSNGAFNRLVVNNGARLHSNLGCVGLATSSSNNLALVTGPGSLWYNAAALVVGNSGMGNQLVVSNGGFVAATDPGTPLIVGNGLNSANNEVVITGAGSVYSNVAGINVNLGENGSSNRLRIEAGGLLVANVLMGYGPTSTGNVLTVTGPGSRLFVPRDDIEIFVGGNGPGNLLIVSNGAAVLGDGGAIGYNASSSNNLAVVTGAGSLWGNQNVLQVGRFGPNNRLLITDGGTVSSTNAVNVGFQPTTSSNNLLQVSGGTLRVTNLIATGTLDVRRGTSRLDAGVIEADVVRMTNPPQNVLEFNGGTLSAKNSTISSGTILRLGNGVSPATMFLAGNGLHDFGGNLFVSVSSNAVLTGNGILRGGFTISRGATLMPGASVGKLVFSNSPSLQGVVNMEISKTGATITNDQIAVVGPLTYGGSLVVSNLGPSALAAGDRFPLFSASNYAGGFTNIFLPPLAAGLDWTNKLLVDGSIEVVALPMPRFTGITLSGTNLLLTGAGGTSNAPYAVLTATNVAVPLSNWVSIATNQYDSGGAFSFTIAIDLGELQRYFRLRAP